MKNSKENKYSGVPKSKVLVMAWPNYSESEDKLTFFATKDEFKTLKKKLKRTNMQVTLEGGNYVKFVPCEDCRYVIE